MNLILICAAAFITTVFGEDDGDQCGAVTLDNFSYTDTDCWENISDSKCMDSEWKGRQSPIKVVEVNKEKKDEVVLTYSHSKKYPAKLHVTKSDKKFDISPVERADDAKSFLEVKVDDRKVKYNFHGYHFHAKAEHFIGDAQHDLELHAVHSKADKGKDADASAVIGVLFKAKEDAEDNGFLKAVIDVMEGTELATTVTTTTSTTTSTSTTTTTSTTTSTPTSTTTSTTTSTSTTTTLTGAERRRLSDVTDQAAIKELDLRRLLTDVDSTLETLVMYKGSLTTPPCSPEVHWFLFTEPIIAPPAQLEKFSKLFVPGNVRKISDKEGWNNGEVTQAGHEGLLLKSGSSRSSVGGHLSSFVAIVAVAMAMVAL